jgi:hypothetical protein
MLVTCCLGALDALDCRAGKLLVAKKPFIAVANDEPYFMGIYAVVRENEQAQGTWTPEDEDAFTKAWKERQA